MAEFEMPDYKVKLDELGHMVGFELAGDLYHSEDPVIHAEVSVFEMPEYKVKLDDLGHMIGFELADDVYHSFNGVDDFLAHYGVKGMKWGVRKDAGELGVPAKTARMAKKDAEEFTKAKMFYGEGAGTRRKLIKAKVEQRMSDPLYKKAFDHYTSQTDLAKRSDQARGERRRKDISNSTRKTARATKNVLVGNSRNATIAGFAAAAGVREAHNRGWDRQALNLGKEAVRNVLNYAKHDDFDGEPFDDAVAHISNDELLHYGVKGMKWGVRKNDDDGPLETYTSAKAAEAAVGNKMISRQQHRAQLKMLRAREARDLEAAKKDPTFKREVEAAKRGEGVVKTLSEGKTTSEFLPGGYMTARFVGDFRNSEGKPVSVEFANAVLSEASKGRSGPLVEHSNLIQADVIEAFENDIYNTLAHYGVKGMKWGVRKDRDDGSADSGPVSEDHARAVAALTKASTHGLAALSTKEMRELTNRLEAERKFNQLSGERARAQRSVGKKFIDYFVGEAGDFLVKEGSNMAKSRARDVLRDMGEAKKKSNPAPKKVKNLDEVLKPYSNRR